MGYTHYWRRPPQLDKAMFKLWSEDVAKIVAAVEPGGLAGERGIGLSGGTDHEPAQITDKIVYLNGVGEAAHEPFAVEQTFTPDYHRPDQWGRYFDFCKTARKPYDLIVAAALIRMKVRFKDTVQIASDGDGFDHEWQDALSLCDKLFGDGVFGSAVLPMGV